MILEDLQALIATGETQLLEYKRSGTAHLSRAAHDELILICDITPALDSERLLENLGLLKQRRMTYAGSLLLCSTSSLVVPGSAVNCCLFQGRTTTRILD